MNFARVKLSRLQPGGDIDARSTASNIAALAASIKAVGLMQPLVVRRLAEDDRFQVVAGNRRFAALKKLHGRKDVEVPVMIADTESDADAFEKSLAENVIREALHPVDEFEAYSRLSEAGMTPAKIADRFGVKEKWVLQRLQLKRLAPDLREAWRKGKMTAAQAEALTAAENHESQRQAWARAQKQGDYYARPEQIRASLRSTGYAIDDRCVKFIGGVEAYKAAGGGMSEDLFADAITLSDFELIDRLVAEKLEAHAADLRAQGWARVEVDDGPGWGELIDLSPWMTEAERKTIAADRYSKAARAARERAAEEAMKDPAARARSAVTVYLGNDGEIACTYLRALDEDDAEADNNTSVEADEFVDRNNNKAAPEQASADADAKTNWALRETTSEWLTLAISDALLADTHVALAALGASLAYAISYHSNASPLRVKTWRAWDALAGEREPGNPGLWRKEFARLCDADEEKQREALSILAAKLLDLRAPRFDSRGEDYVEGRPEFVRAFGYALPRASLVSAIDKYFDREAYFGHLTKDEIAAALVDMGWPGNHPKKKGDMAKAAAERAKAIGWLPAELHLPGVTSLKP